MEIRRSDSSCPQPTAVGSGAFVPNAPASLGLTPAPVYRCQFSGRATPYPQTVTSLRRPLSCSCSGRHRLHLLPESLFVYTVVWLECREMGLVPTEPRLGTTRLLFTLIVVSKLLPSLPEFCLWVYCTIQSPLCTSSLLPLRRRLRRLRSASPWQ